MERTIANGQNPSISAMDDEQDVFFSEENFDNAAQDDDDYDTEEFYSPLLAAQKRP